MCSLTRKRLVSTENRFVKSVLKAMMHNVETLKNRNVYIIDIYALLIHGYIYAECKEMSMY